MVEDTLVGDLKVPPLSPKNIKKSKNQKSGKFIFFTRSVLKVFETST